MDKSELKEKFVHLHVHNSFSFKDGVGTPYSRVEYAAKNNLPAVATSNHGNIADWIAIYNGCKKHGLKPILGCELYFNRQAEEFRRALDSTDKEDVQKRKELRKQNRHFTVFAKNLTGYYNIIKMHNDAWMNGFYHVPITSPDVIEKHGEGVIATSGCASSEINRLLAKKKHVISSERPEEIKKHVEAKTDLMKKIFRSKKPGRHFEDENFTQFEAAYYEAHQGEDFDEDHFRSEATRFLEESDKEFIKTIDEQVDELVDWWTSVFKDYYIEIMTIDFEEQSYVNEQLIQLARRKNIPMILTNDSHYISRTDAGVQELQMLSDQKKTFEDVKKGNAWTIKTQELYYKNIDELYDAWEEWHKSDIFTEDVFWEAAENTVKLVDSVEEFELDKSSKLPKLYGEKSEKILIKKIHDGMKKHGLVGNKEYEDRIKFELKIIKKKGFVDYFLIMDDIISWAKETYGDYSVGPGRGSAAGSLINYVLGLTKVDPIKHDLLFERFLDIEREDVVDIDCLHELTAIKLSDGNIKLLKDIKTGDIVLDHNNESQKILNWTTRSAKKGYEKIVEVVVDNDGELGSFISPGHHRMINNKNEVKFVYELNIGDKIKSFDGESIIIDIKDVEIDYDDIKLCDIQVENSKTFQIYPFNVDKNLTCQNNIFETFL